MNYSYSGSVGYVIWNFIVGKEIYEQYIFGCVSSVNASPVVFPRNDNTL